jgi:prepilin-type N-terminal cleavage/methylation domain-containing protein
MKSMTTKISKRRMQGFSLLELLVAVAILGTIVAIAVQAGNQLVRTNNNVSNNVDLVQEGRQFMDQISSDIHMAGFPNYKMFDQSAPANTGNASFPNSYAGTYNSTNYKNSQASGLTSATVNSLVFEGDVDNSGTVSKVTIQLCAGSNPGTNCTAPTTNSQCPCTMQRGIISKSQAGSPPFYTELSGVLNTNVFTFFDYTGAPSDPSTSTGLINTRAIRIQLQVQSTHRDVANGNYSIVTLDSEAKLSN